MIMGSFINDLQLDTYKKYNRTFSHMTNKMPEIRKDIANFSNVFAKAITGGFPFFNIIKNDDNSFVVELALAGFTKDDVTVSEQNSTVTVTGETKDEDADYIHKGITSKQFTRSFILADHVHVASVKMKDGLLRIALERQPVKEEEPKLFDIE